MDLPLRPKKGARVNAVGPGVIAESDNWDMGRCHTAMPPASSEMLARFLSSMS
jgi:hypothetical protein